jgi:hypothetical protein
MPALAHNRPTSWPTAGAAWSHGGGGRHAHVPALALDQRHVWIDSAASRVDLFGDDGRRIRVAPGA